MFYGNYPVSGGGGGVTTLNGLSGAITLVAGTGITITPSGSNITIAATGGAFANQSLSNLTSPTAINQDLLPGITNTINLGSPSKLFASVSAVEYDVYTSGGVIGGSIIASGSDLELSSPNGSILLAATSGGKDIQLNSPTVLTNATVIKTITDLQADLGTSALRFSNLFLANLVLSSGVGSTITQQAAASTSPYTVLWPNAQGAASTVLQNDGAGNLSWVTQTVGANTSLSNLTPTSINQSLIPNANNTFDLGSVAIEWENIYARFIHTPTITAGSNPLQLNTDMGVQVSGSSSSIQGTVQIYEALTNGSNFIGLTVSPTLASTTTYQLPPDGSSGQFLSTNGSGILSWAGAPASPINNKELFVLSPTNITNQYIDLAHVALTNSIDFLVKGAGTQIEGASYDYSVNYTGGAGGFTRITFLNGLATGGISALVAGDVVVAKYEY